MTPPDFARELGAVRGQRVRGRADAAPVGLLPRAQPRPPASPGSTTSAAGRTRAPGVPGVLLGAEVTAGLVVRTTAAAAGGGERGMSAEPVLDRGARDDATASRATFALACRLLPRDVRDDVYLLYLVFRTLDDLVDDGAPGRRPSASPRSRRGRAGGRRAHARGRRCSPTSLRRHPLPRDALARLLRGHARRPRRRRARDRGRPRRATATASPGRSGVVMTALLGARDPERAAPGRRRARAWRCSARTSCATSTRTSRAGRVYLARETLERFGGSLRPGAARRCCATRSPAPTRSTTGHRRHRAAAPRAPRDRRRRRDVPRDPAPDRARGLRRAPGPRRRPAAAQAARSRPAPRGARPLRAHAARAARGAARGARRRPARRPRRAQAACGRVASPAATRGIVGADARDVARRGGRGRAGGAGAPRSAAAAGAVGFAAELVGVPTGRPFGHYSYSAQLGRASAACRCWRRRRGR